MIEIINVNEVVTVVTSAPEVIAALNIASEIIIVYTFVDYWKNLSMHLIPWYQTWRYLLRNPIQTYFLLQFLLDRL